jgi:hypothetical protein
VSLTYVSNCMTRGVLEAETMIRSSFPLDAYVNIGWCATCVEKMLLQLTFAMLLLFKCRGEDLRAETNGWMCFKMQT